MSGKRYNQGKYRYTLISDIALQELAKVYTLGAHKYSIYKNEYDELINGYTIPFSEQKKYELVEDGGNNWRLGLKWLSVMDSVKRHIQAWSQGEDIDRDLGTYHLSNAMWGLSILLDYYKSYPEGDDRIIADKRIGLVIDNILFNEYSDEPLMRELPFSPKCYFTYNFSEDHIKKYNFPNAPVYKINNEEEKLGIISKENLNIVIESSWYSFITLTQNHVNAYLYTTPSNSDYYIKCKRIRYLSEIIHKNSM